MIRELSPDAAPSLTCLPLRDIHTRKLPICWASVSARPSRITSMPVDSCAKK
jgi:hypothetical protein